MFILASRKFEQMIAARAVPDVPINLVENKALKNLRKFGSISATMIEPKPELVVQRKIKFDADVEIYRAPINSIMKIQETVAEFYSVTMTELISPRRQVSITRPRQIAMWLAKELTSRSFPDIGRRFGGRDHTTVLHAIRKISELIGKDSKLADEIAELKYRLVNGSKV